LTFERDLEMVKLKERAEYLHQRSSSWNVIIRTHRDQWWSQDIFFRDRDIWRDTGVKTRDEPRH